VGVLFVTVRDRIPIHLADRVLAQAPRTVDELARANGQSSAKTSQHLQALYAAGTGMVTRAREGNRVRYAVAGGQALALWLALRDASMALLGEVERAARHYLGAEVEAIGRDGLVARLSRGDGVGARAAGPLRANRARRTERFAQTL